MLCNPHNPVGRVWTREELLRLGRYADHHDWLICSDDIHCGLVLDAQSTYRPIAALDESLAQRTITLMAPSKTWNIPALSTAFAIIPNAQLRQQFILAGQGLISSPNLLGLVATEAAYRHGDPWRQALLGYLRENARLVTDNIASMPGLRSTPVEATYLAWIDCRELNQARPQRFFELHGVGLSDGKDFGMEGYVRLNFACSRSLLSQALSRMQAALSAG
jgi:cystathionine beta-lyase